MGSCEVGQLQDWWSNRSQKRMSAAAFFANKFNLTISVSIVIATIMAIILWVFGLQCINHGTHCGPCGHPDGGALMLPIGTICTIGAALGVCILIDQSCNANQGGGGNRDRDPTMEWVTAMLSKGSSRRVESRCWVRQLCASLV